MSVVFDRGRRVEVGGGKAREKRVLTCSEDERGEFERAIGDALVLWPCRCGQGGSRCRGEREEALTTERGWTRGWSESDMGAATRVGGARVSGGGDES